MVEWAVDFHIHAGKYLLCTSGTQSRIVLAIYKLDPRNEPFRLQSIYGHHRIDNISPTSPATWTWAGRVVTSPLTSQFAFSYVNGILVGT